MACTLILAWLGRVIAVFGSSFEPPSGCSTFQTRQTHNDVTKENILCPFYNKWGWKNYTKSLHYYIDIPCTRLLRYSGVHQCLSALNILLYKTFWSISDFLNVVSETTKNKMKTGKALLQLWCVEHSQSGGLCGLPSVDCPPKSKTSAWVMCQVHTADCFTKGDRLFMVLCRTQQKIFWRMLVTKQFWYLVIERLWNLYEYYGTNLFKNDSNTFFFRFRI